MYNIEFKHTGNLTTTTNLDGKQIKIIYSSSLEMEPATAEVLITTVISKVTNLPLTKNEICLAIMKVFEQTCEDTISLTITETSDCFVIE